MLHPIGPDRPTVYWRRRLVLIVVLVVAVLLLFRACSGGEDAEAQPGRTAVPDSTPAPSAATPDPATTPDAVATTATATATAGGARACTDDDITVVAAPDAASYPAGTTPRFSLTVRNTSSVPCTRDVGSAALELSVTSGDQPVWSSDQCRPRGDSSVQTLPPDGTQVTRLSWPRVRTNAACPTPRPGADPGTYRLTGRAGKVTSEPAVFVLR